MMVSIKRFLEKSSGENELSSALLRLAHLLFTGIAMHAVEVNKAEYEQFRDDIERLDRELGDRPTASEALVIAGTTIRAMDEYGKRATRFSKGHRAEFQNMLAMFADTVTVLSSGNNTAVLNLQAIERQLQDVSMIEDIRTIKARLSECLATVQAESFRQKQESARTLLQMQQHLQDLKKESEQPARARDPLTGLPDRSEADKALHEALEHCRPACVAVFLVRHMEVINGRFGYVIGDQILNLFGAHIRQKLKADDQVFRWRGPCFLALLERSSPIREVRAELDRICSARLETFAESGTRSALVPISSNWAVFDLQRMQTLGDLNDRIEVFIRKEKTESPSAPQANLLRIPSTA
jgi:diguanylate cyclase (GGDEF)-like protein